MQNNSAAAYHDGTRQQTRQTTLRKSVFESSWCCGIRDAMVTMTIHAASHCLSEGCQQKTIAYAVCKKQKSDTQRRGITFGDQ